MKVTFKRHAQSVDSHAGPLFYLDGTVAGSWRLLLEEGGNADAHHQTAGQDAVVSRVHRDDEGNSGSHGFTFKSAHRK